MGNAKIKAPDTLFLPFQARWIEDKSIMKIAEKSRQIGFTWCTAYSDTVTTASQANNLDLWITSRDEIQAKLYIQDCRNWGNIFQVGAMDLGEAVFEDKKGNKVSSATLTFSNGKIIYSLSSNPNAQAGKRGRRRGDEFALNRTNRLLYSIMEPGITWDGDLWLWSTHRGTNNYFNELILEAREGGNPKNFSVHRITLEDALNEGLLDKLQSKWSPNDPRQEMDETDYFNYVRNRAADEETFLQEYMCVPSDDNSAFISYDLIDRSLYPAGTFWEEVLNPTSRYCIGVDIGRTTDLTVIWIIEENGSHRLTRRIFTMADTPFSDQEAVLYQYIEKPYVRRVCIDASGIGRQFAERARQRFGHKVEPVVFTAGVKEDLAISLRRCMEDGYLRIPDSKEVIADFRNIRKETTSAGNVRYVGERTANGHSDRFWAAALAIHAAKAPATVAMPAPLPMGTGYNPYRPY